MAKFNLSPTKNSERTLFGELQRHYQIGFDETQRRTTGKNRIGSLSFDEADELFRSWIDEANWPYDALLVDPRVFTFIFDKTARLIAGKPQGRVIPREGADVLAAEINNALLVHQWDQATRGGPMVAKYALMDINTRKYGAAFALCKWRYEVDSKGKVVFDGPEMEVLNNRDFAHDLSTTSIESANWVQVRQYITFQELERVNDQAREKPIYKNLSELREAISTKGEGTGGGDIRSSNWTSRNRAISKLELDPVGKDPTFKVVEAVTEYRRDRWITFAPKHGVVIRDIENPYRNNEIPVVMLRYYMIDDDLYGLSEIEPIKGLQKAVNAILSQYVDEINQHLYTPIAVGPGVRQHTLEWGKGARWIMNNPMTDFRLVESRSNAAQYFNNTYSALVSAMMNALGESSLGVSNIQPYQRDKTATEVRAISALRSARDNFNQVFLAEAIKRQTMLWHSMNQLLLFSDPTKKNYIIRIVGKKALSYFKKRGLNEMIIPEEAYALLREQKSTDTTGLETPRFPVNLGTEKEPKIAPKLTLEEDGGSGQLVVEPEDLKGSFDFIIDVGTMTLNAEEERKASKQAAITLLVSNPNVIALLAQEGVSPKFKDLFVSWLEGLGFVDADKYFESKENRGETPGNPMGSHEQGPSLKDLGLGALENPPATETGNGNPGNPNEGVGQFPQQTFPPTAGQFPGGLGQNEQR